MKVEQFYSLNQFHLYNNDNIDILQSYNSKVVEITKNKLENSQKIVLGRDWDYSTTTSKYVYKFLDEFSKVRIYGVANKRKYINDLLEECKENSEEFVKKYGYTITYNEEMI